MHTILLGSLYGYRHTHTHTCTKPHIRHLCPVQPWGPAGSLQEGNKSAHHFTSLPSPLLSPSVTHGLNRLEGKVPPHFDVNQKAHIFARLVLACSALPRVPFCLEPYLIRILFELDNLGAIRNMKLGQCLLHPERCKTCSRIGMPALLRHFAHGLQYLI